MKIVVIKGVSNYYLLFINFKATLISNLGRVYELLDTPWSSTIFISFLYIEEYGRHP